MTWIAQNNRPDVEGGTDDLSMIPLWSVILSVLMFAGIQYLSYSHPPPPGHRNPVMLRLWMTGAEFCDSLSEVF